MDFDNPYGVQQKAHFLQVVIAQHLKAQSGHRHLTPDFSERLFY